MVALWGDNPGKAPGRGYEVTVVSRIIWYAVFSGVDTTELVAASVWCYQGELVEIPSVLLLVWPLVEFGYAAIQRFTANEPVAIGIELELDVIVRHDSPSSVLVKVEPAAISAKVKGELIGRQLVPGV